MDKDLKYLYYVLLTGENIIKAVNASYYEMKWRITSGPLVSAGEIELDIHDSTGLRICKGIDAFRWHVSKHCE